MISKPFLRSFAGGEITPELFGRLDLTKNKTIRKGGLGRGSSSYRLRGTPKDG